MKYQNYYLFGLILISLFVVGCGRQALTTTTCNKPYIVVGTECCLDQDDNSICDKDEPSNKENLENSQLGRPVQALTVEDCASNTYFECPYSYIHKDSIEFDLKAKKAGLAVITKIDFPNVPCTQGFEEVPRDLGMTYNNVKKFIINCDIQKDAVESEMVIDLIYYEWDAKFNEYKEPVNVITTGWISGIVR